jgi:hypothetical protein
MRWLHSGAKATYIVAQQVIRQHVINLWIDSSGMRRPPLVALPLTFRDTDHHAWTLEQYAGTILRNSVGIAIESAAHAAEDHSGYAANGHA